MNPDASANRSRFERRPWLGWLTALGVILFLTESLLRITSPDTLRFAYEFRQVYRYHDRWYTDFDPSTSAHIQLAAKTGYLLNFLVTINEYGFRFYDQSIDHQGKLTTSTAFIHAIGDSFTMGWGVNFEASYPALLDTMLPPDTEVLNLGLNGFGAVGATEKSLQLMTRFPPSYVVYLATANDYDDDAKVLRYARYPWLLHRGMGVVNWLRQHTYVASVPFAIRWWLYYRRVQIDRQHIERWGEMEAVTRRDVDGPSDPQQGRATKAALERYAHVLAVARVPFLVVAHGHANTVKDIIRFCQERQIDTLLLEMPASLTLVGDGHFNVDGNRQLAKLVLGHLKHHDSTRRP